MAGEAKPPFLYPSFFNASCRGSQVGRSAGRPEARIRLPEHSCETSEVRTTLLFRFSGREGERFVGEIVRGVACLLVVRFCLFVGFRTRSRTRRRFLIWICYVVT